MLHKRFETSGEPIDLDTSIDVHHQALSLRSVQHPERGSSLNNLGIVYFESFHATGRPGDLENAMVFTRDALEFHRPGHPRRGDTLGNLAMLHRERFGMTGEQTDLDTAINLHQETLDLRSDHHPSRVVSLNNIGHALLQRFSKNKQPLDLNNAIEMFQQALTLTLAPHPERATIFYGMAMALTAKYDATFESHVLDEAMDFFRNGSTYPFSTISKRFDYSRDWARVADERNHPSALEAYQTSISLLPQLAMLGKDIQARRRALTSQANLGLASSAAACASHHNENVKAVELLEAARSVFWSQALQLHTPLNDIKGVHPDLAQRLSDISEQLVLASHRDPSSMQMLPAEDENHSLLDKEKRQSEEMSAAWIETIENIRQQPGFEKFLKTKELDELRTAAKNGPVVILNTSSSFCTALIVTFSGDVQCIEVENMTWDIAQFLVQLLDAARNNAQFKITQLLCQKNREGSVGQSQLQSRLFGKMEKLGCYSPDTAFRDILFILWDRIVQPIFRALKLKVIQPPIHIPLILIH
jgi:tetratricopeptide (TPR) repeat protein